MPDIATVGIAYAAITNAINTAKSLNELSKRIDNAELTHAVADLTLALAEVKVELAEALNNNIELRRQLEDANKANSIVPFREWLINTQDPPPRAPVCPQCWAERKIVRMKKFRDDPAIAFICPEHQIKIWVEADDIKELLKKLDASDC